MTFDELLDIKPSINLATVIQLYLLGKDDKVYIELADAYDEDIYTNIRIIDNKLDKYYDCEVLYFEEPYYQDYNIRIVINFKGDKNER